jgi:hypothetical protein
MFSLHCPGLGKCRLLLHLGMRSVTVCCRRAKTSFLRRYSKQCVAESEKFTQRHLLDDPTPSQTYHKTPNQTTKTLKKVMILRVLVFGWEVVLVTRGGVSHLDFETNMLWDNISFLVPCARLSPD